MARRVLARFVGARQSRLVLVWSVMVRFAEVPFGKERHGSQGFAGHVTVMRGEVGPG